MKRKNIVISSFAIMISIALMIFGVYSASNATLNIIGQVSYTVTDAKILVQGKVNGAMGFVDVDYPAADTTDYLQSTKVPSVVGAESRQYLNFTVGGGVDKSDDNLSGWSLGDMQFDESANGITPIIIALKITNFSPYKVSANLQMVVPNTSLNGIKREVSCDTNVIAADNSDASYCVDIGANSDTAQTVEIFVKYTVIDDSVDIDKINVGMEIIFAKDKIEKYPIENINKNNGIVKMGKSNKNNIDEDIEWRCFAYSSNYGKDWTSCYTTGIVPEDATNCYFILDTFLSDISTVFYLNNNKYSMDSDDEKYYHKDLGNKCIYANDYYYSDIRAYTKKQVVTLLNISSDSEVYKSIIGRTISDLYKNNQYYLTDINDMEIPDGANGAEVDMFWLPSAEELLKYFIQSDTFEKSENLKWDNGQDGGASYWTRSSSPIKTYAADLIFDCDIIPGDIGIVGGLRPAFEVSVTNNTTKQETLLDKINNNSGIIKMGKTAANLEEDDIEWRCFAYSADDVTWEKYTAGETVLTTENAKYCYFILKTYVGTLNNQEFLSIDKYKSGIHTDLTDLGDGVTVGANDYYYSDIRSLINNNAKNYLRIDETNKFYNSLVPRTINDLYKMNKLDGWNSSSNKFTSIKDGTLPAGADENTADEFWLLSMYELQTFFDSGSGNTSTDRQWLNRTSGVQYYTRSANAYYSSDVGYINSDGGIYSFVAGLSRGARVGFKLDVS